MGVIDLKKDFTGNLSTIDTVLLITINLQENIDRKFFIHEPRLVLLRLSRSLFRTRIK